jgi:hypothetical protein
MNALDLAASYLGGGWEPLPLPSREKAPPPAGYTGGDGAAVTIADWKQWIADGIASDESNIGLRMPPGVVGIDVDHYGNKFGADEIAKLEQQLGPLPVTARSTSRHGTRSAISFFTVPLDVKFPGKPCDSVEFIQRHHRYAVVWPSVHPDTGEMYGWIEPEWNEVTNSIPALTDLAPLPQSWVDYFAETNNSTSSVVGAGQQPRPHLRDSVPSKAVDAALGSYYREAPGGRHDAATKATMTLVRLKDSGHPGADDALDQIRGTFITGVTGDGSRTPGAAEREWTRLVESAECKVSQTASTRPPYDELVTVRGLQSAALNPGGQACRSATNLPESFWSARPVLEHIRQAAHARGRSADATLLVVLARVSASTPHYFELPPIVGGPGSLNLMGNLIGASGTGKTTVMRIARELVPVSAARDRGVHLLDGVPLGSGEGLAELFMGDVEDEDASGKKAKVRKQTMYNAFVYVDEGEAITNMIGRTGSTLMESLRRCWSGSTLGQSNASKDRSRVIPEGNYRLAMIVGYQPEKAGVLLSDATGGTPQRFLWASTIDPSVPDQPPKWPGPLAWPSPDSRAVNDQTITDDRGYRRVRLTVVAQIGDEIRTAGLARVRGIASVDPLDSHGDLQRLKIGGLLAILDGRLNVTVDDWDLAGVVNDTSKAVRGIAEASVAADSERVEAAKVSSHARREVAGAVARQSAPEVLARLACRIAGYVHEATDKADVGLTRSMLAKCLNNRERDNVDAAISEAIRLGWITERDGRYLAHGPVQI